MTFTCRIFEESIPKPFEEDLEEVGGWSCLPGSIENRIQEIVKESEARIAVIFSSNPKKIKGYRKISVSEIEDDQFLKDCLERSFKGSSAEGSKIDTIWLSKERIKRVVVETLTPPGGELTGGIYVFEHTTWKKVAKGICVESEHNNYVENKVYSSTTPLTSDNPYFEKVDESWSLKKGISSGSFSPDSSDEEGLAPVFLPEVEPQSEDLDFVPSPRNQKRKEESSESRDSSDAESSTGVESEHSKAKLLRQRVNSSGSFSPDSSDEEGLAPVFLPEVEPQSEDLDFVPSPRNQKRKEESSESRDSSDAESSTGVESAHSKAKPLKQRVNSSRSKVRSKNTAQHEKKEKFTKEELNKMFENLQPEKKKNFFLRRGPLAWLLKFLDYLMTKRSY